MITMLLPVLLLAAARVLDRLFEEPRPALHPVCWMGQAADFWERTLRRDKNSPVGMRLRGLAALLCMEACFVLPALILVVLCQNLWLPLGWCAAAICIWLCLAPHSLARHARAVLAPLHRGNLETARLKLSWIVGRNTNVLDEAGIARASVESVAENCTDGVLSTLFWAFAGYLLGGLPLAAALPVAQRVANTLDAMWGKKNERYIYFGCCAARLDDVFNGNHYLITGIIGVLSSIIDNVPLVAGCMGMYPMAAVGDMAQDGIFWQLLAYCAGVGGSMLIIGSAAGVVVMGLEKITFGWYMKRITWIAFVGYVAGIVVYWLEKTVIGL